MYGRLAVGSTTGSGVGAGPLRRRRQRRTADQTERGEPHRRTADQRKRPEPHARIKVLPGRGVPSSAAPRARLLHLCGTQRAKRSGRVLRYAATMAGERLSGGQALVRSLVGEGVEVVFGL